MKKPPITKKQVCATHLLTKSMSGKVYIQEMCNQYGLIQRAAMVIPFAMSTHFERGFVPLSIDYTIPERHN